MKGGTKHQGREMEAEGINRRERREGPRDHGPQDHFVFFAFFVVKSQDEKSAGGASGSLFFRLSQP
jgi:hypothetical protein